MSARTTATSPAEVRGKIKITPRASILLVVLFLGAVFAVAPARAYLDARAEREALSQQVAALETQNAALRDRVADLNDPNTIERMARECLGMVKPGEIAFVPVPEGGAPAARDCG
jgi:cell division protein FtsL